MCVKHVDAIGATLGGSGGTVGGSGMGAMGPFGDRWGAYWGPFVKRRRNSELCCELWQAMNTLQSIEARACVGMSLYICVGSLGGRADGRGRRGRGGLWYDELYVKVIMCISVHIGAYT